MLKAKFCGFAIACIMGCAAINPVYAYAADTKTESVTLSPKGKTQKDKKAAFDEAMNKASEKWTALNEKQKAEVYALIEDEIKAEIRLMDKLLEFGIISKEDATTFKARMMERFKKVKESGEFPLARPKGNKSSK